MNGVSLLLALVAAAPAPPSPQDTAVVVQGLLVQRPGVGWLMALPAPILYRNRVIAEVLLAGDSVRWSGLAGQYVEARGAIGGEPSAGGGPRPRGVLRVEAVREVDPPGTARKTVSESFAHRVAVSLWVLPRVFAWTDPAGRPTGVGPAVAYTLNNHGESDVTLTFESQDFVCFVVAPVGGGAPPWRFSRRLDEPPGRVKVTLPKFLREVTPLPRDAAPTAGRYRVRASLCGFPEYEVETEIEVRG